MTNFRFFQTKEFAYDNLTLLKMAVSFPNRWKTLGKEGIISNFCVSHIVFKRFVLQTLKNKGLFGKGFTLCHTIMTFNDPVEKAFGKHCWKRRKCWSPAFSAFPAMFPILLRTFFKFSVTFKLSSANLNLDQSRIMSFGKELTCLISKWFQLERPQIFF